MNLELKDGRHPLFVAVTLIQGAAEWTRRLLARDAKYDVVTTRTKQTALMYAISCRPPDDELKQICEALCRAADNKNGSSRKQFLSMKDHSGGPALAYACRLVYCPASATNAARYKYLDADQISKGVPQEALNGK